MVSCVLDTASGNSELDWLECLNGNRQNLPSVPKNLREIDIAWRQKWSHEDCDYTNMFGGGVPTNIFECHDKPSGPSCGTTFFMRTSILFLDVSYREVYEDTEILCKNLCTMRWEDSGRLSHGRHTWTLHEVHETLTRNYIPCLESHRRPLCEWEEIETKQTDKAKNVQRGVQLITCIHHQQHVMLGIQATFPCLHSPIKHG